MSNGVRLTIVILLFSLTAQAQTFNSGSTGVDGALNIAGSGVVVFDPVALGIDTDGDNIYNFTTITIPAGVTLKIQEKNLRKKGSLVWLASGAVQINGTIDVSGGDGHPAGNLTLTNQAFSDPGPGGYSGGLGGTQTSPPTPGSGPGGGQSGLVVGGPGCDGAHAVDFVFCAQAYGNRALIPLRGGSGGGGAIGGPAVGAGSGGGAGGGAIRIASSSSISIAGAILANGGNGGTPNPSGYRGGGGSGGAIHLIAPAISGAGLLSVAGGAGGNSFGRLRLEAFTQAFTGTYAPTPGQFFAPQFGTPYALPVTAVAPSGNVRITSVAGVAVPATPTASLTNPDVTINQSGSVTVAIEASNITLGTVVTLNVISESSPFQSVASTPLAGTLALSTATATITFPPGFSKGWIVAKW